jgi:hypothetical protein
MRILILLLLFSMIASGCTKKENQENHLLPREYYHSLINISEIGVAFSTKSESNAIIPTLLSNEKISDAIFITHEDVTLIGLRIKPYYRSNEKELIQEVSSHAKIAVSSIIVDPRKYRIMERLVKEKQKSGVNENWVREWSTLQEEPF